jgi:hypothetical protein
MTNLIAGSKSRATANIKSNGGPFDSERNWIGHDGFWHLRGPSREEKALRMTPFMAPLKIERRI